jgi:hypothetical protein
VNGVEGRQRLGVSQAAITTACIEIRMMQLYKENVSVKQERSAPLFSCGQVESDAHRTKGGGQDRAIYLFGTGLVKRTPSSYST